VPNTALLGTATLLSTMRLHSSIRVRSMSERASFAVWNNARSPVICDRLIARSFHLGMSGRRGAWDAK
jgi:hypothetical protein